MCRPGDPPPRDRPGATATKSGTEIFVPLNKLKKSPRNARKMPHTSASIEALAASIAVKGMLQNLVVGPERAEGGAESLALRR